ncbi:MAG: hypothetical protein HZB67_03580 [Candidatus Aenigmarchaeota archaeon]|nr:hypothetical protein [Candidatus Aenigmarchaeota archaeon]
MSNDYVVFLKTEYREEACTALNECLNCDSKVITEPDYMGVSMLRGIKDPGIIARLEQNDFYLIKAVGNVLKPKRKGRPGDIWKESSLNDNKKNYIHILEGWNIVDFIGLYSAFYDLPKVAVYVSSNVLSGNKFYSNYMEALNKYRVFIPEFPHNQLDL